MEDKENLKCLRCNRKLKNEGARKRGYGPHCWKQYQIAINDSIPFLFDINSINKKGEI